MKKLITVFILIISIRGFGQQPDHYVLPTGDTVKVGDKVIVGPGTMPDGKYKYIESIVTLGPGFAGQVMNVRAILLRGNKKIGYKYYLKLHPGAGIVNYQAYAEYAFKSGELQIKN